METTQLSFFTEYYQFYILDADTKAATDAVDFWNDTADKNRIAIGDGLLGVTVAKYAEIKVEIRICDTKPAIDEIADHVVDTPLYLSSGKIEIRSCTGFDLKFEKELEIGDYTVRVASYNLNAVVNDKGDDYYVVEVWKSEETEVSLLKEWKK
jgi:hypothetical protein